jgi:hypothetical protein
MAKEQKGKTKFLKDFLTMIPILFRRKIQDIKK